MKMTKHRTELLTTLEHQSEALTAAELHTLLPHINLVTIYRNLEQFVEAGTVKKLYLDEQEAYYEIQEEPHHHAICTTCGDVIHFTFDDSDLAKSFRLPGFSIAEVDVTVRGLCNKHRLQKKPRTKTKQK